MKHKSEARQSLQDFIALCETQFQTKMQTIRLDNDLEFSMLTYFKYKGIIHQTSCIETLEQNSIVERKYQHILNFARVLLFQASLLKHYWSYAILLVVDIINRLLTPFLNSQTPFFNFFFFSHLTKPT